MQFSRTRLDRFLKRTQQISKQQCRQLLAQKRLSVDGDIATSAQHLVTQFSHVKLDGVSIQNYSPLYIVLHKPLGVVSATSDDQHRTVLDLINHPRKQTLHLAGRLDKNSTGLILLSNDGAWSRGLSLPQNNVTKTYQVTVAKPITDDMVTRFKEGIYFKTEGATTQPASLVVTGSHSGIVTLSDGKYHQIKRMFGVFRNPVLSIHRTRIGDFSLPEGLGIGEWRLLNHHDLQSVGVPHESPNTY